LLSPSSHGSLASKCSSSTLLVIKMRRYKDAQSRCRQYSIIIKTWLSSLITTSIHLHALSLSDLIIYSSLNYISERSLPKQDPLLIMHFSTPTLLLILGSSLALAAPLPGADLTELSLREALAAPPPGPPPPSPPPPPQNGGNQPPPPHVRDIEIDERAPPPGPPPPPKNGGNPPPPPHVRDVDENLEERAPPRGPPPPHNNGGNRPPPPHA
jgi:hypothetical protein